MDESASQVSDEVIAAAVQKGDREKFGVLMERYYPRLLRYGKKFIARKENIEDVVQDVFVSTYQNIMGFDSSLKFSSWIYRIAHNAFVNALKKEKRGPLLGIELDLDTFVSHNVVNEELAEKDHAELKKMIGRGLGEIKPKYREVLILHYLDELGYKEISDILQVPVGTVGIRLKRARESLKKVYEGMNLNPREHYEH